METQFNHWKGAGGNSFDVVRMFERRVAEFAGSKYAIAVATGTWALFLCAKYLFPHFGTRKVVIPAKTFISVPEVMIDAGYRIKFNDVKWTGKYELFPLMVIDGALRWQKGMYVGGLHCLSFHARKSLPIGEGGMILTDNEDDANELRALSYCGRRAPLYRVEDVYSHGYNAYMNPEKAARGLHLMDYTQDEPDQIVHYPDLRTVPIFKGYT